MKVYLVRHGHAPFITPDHDRVLSDDGRTQVQQLAQHLLQYGANNAQIYHSGILRAQQTADIIARCLGITSPQQIAGLCPDDAVDIILAQLTIWQMDVILVSHLPYLPHLLAALCADGADMEFGTATAVCLEAGQGGSWQIVEKFL